MPDRREPALSAVVLRRRCLRERRRIAARLFKKVPKESLNQNQDFDLTDDLQVALICSMFLVDWYNF